MRNYEDYERKRNKYVGFRLSPEEKKRLDKYVKMSGLTFREYVAKKVLNEDVVIIGNTKVYKALKEQLNEIAKRLKEMEDSDKADTEFLKVTAFALKIYEGMKNDG